MFNVIRMKKEATTEDEVTLTEKQDIILYSLFGNDEQDKVFRVFINEKKNEGKIYLPLSTSIAGLVNNPVAFKIKVEVREDKTVIYF